MYEPKLLTDRELLDLIDDFPYVVGLDDEIRAGFLVCVDESGTRVACRAEIMVNGEWQFNSEQCAEPYMRTCYAVSFLPGRLMHLYHSYIDEVGRDVLYDASSKKSRDLIIVGNWQADLHYQIEETQREFYEGDVNASY